jgi:hypothetical protein
MCCLPLQGRHFIYRISLAAYTWVSPASYATLGGDWIRRTVGEQWSRVSPQTCSKSHSLDGLVLPVRPVSFPQHCDFLQDSCRFASHSSWDRSTRSTCSPKSRSWCPTRPAFELKLLSPLLLHIIYIHIYL